MGSNIKDRGNLLTSRVNDRGVGQSYGDRKKRLGTLHSENIGKPVINRPKDKFNRTVKKNIEHFESNAIFKDGKGRDNGLKPRAIMGLEGGALEKSGVETGMISNGAAINFLDKVINNKHLHTSKSIQKAKLALMKKKTLGKTAKNLKNTKPISTSAQMIKAMASKKALKPTKS